MAFFTVFPVSNPPTAFLKHSRRATSAGGSEFYYLNDKGPP
jgi:hypothetical protein